MDLRNIQVQTTWNKASQDLNHNFGKVDVEVEKLKNATTRDKGYYLTEEALVSAFPTASVGSRAFVGYTAPFAVYVWDSGTNSWVDSGETLNAEIPINLGDYYTKHEVDNIEVSLEGYAEEVANTAEENAKTYADRAIAASEERTSVALDGKADLEEGRIPLSQMPVGVVKNVFLTEEEYESLVESGQVQEGVVYNTYEDEEA